MKKTILLATFPLLFMDACSSFKLEKRNSNSEQPVAKHEAKEFPDSSMKFIRLDDASFRKSLRITRDIPLEAIFIVQPFKAKSSKKSLLKKDKPLIKTLSRAKF